MLIVGILDKEPIFIIGYHKSSNTLLMRIIATALDSPIVEGGGNPIDQNDRKKATQDKYVIHKLHDTGQSKSEQIKELSKILYIVKYLFLKKPI